MEEYKRKQLLERIQREGATIGVTIPETITVQDKEINLREFIFEIKRQDTVPINSREQVEQAKKNLRRERLQRKQQIEEGNISYEEGEQLVRNIIGIDRALNALENLGSASIEEETQAQQAIDQKRWLSFLKQALGHDNNTNRGVQ